jgi:hypothetical protein
MNDEYISIPMLTTDGSNWVNYQDRLVVILQVKKLLDHLISDTLTLCYTIPNDVNGLMPVQCWANNEDLTLMILNASILDTIYTQVKGGTNVKATWDALKLLFKGHFHN